MPAGLKFRNNDRLLVVVPHPDDETLATGGLIQVALAAGLPLRVIVATDGDDNPWPQRWLERRWHIDGSARVRWGKRRREEARSALSLLGVPDDAYRFFGWPDQGLTAMLLLDSSAEEMLAAEIRQFSPTVVALPSLADRHPDHSALRVMCEMALVGARSTKCRKLGYLVHGKRIGNGGFSLPLHSAQAQLKQRALLAHSTQLSLSRRRMLALCERVEQYESAWLEHEPIVELPRLGWSLPWGRAARWLRRHELLLVLGIPGSAVRVRLPLPQCGGSMRTTVGVGEGLPVDVDIIVHDDSLAVSMATRQRLQLAYAKIERVGPRLLIYDRTGWDDMCAQGHGGAEQALLTSPATGP